MGRDICRLGSAWSILQTPEIGFNFIKIGLEFHLMWERNIRLGVLLEPRVRRTVDHHPKVRVSLQIRCRGCTQRDLELDAIPRLFTDWYMLDELMRLYGGAGCIPLHSITEVRGDMIVKKGLSLKTRRPENLSVISGEVYIVEVIGIAPCELDWGAMGPNDKGRDCDGVG